MVTPRWPRQIVFGDVDAMFASSAIVANPALAGKLVAVGSPPPRGIIASAGYPARRYGVKSAMPTARALARKFPWDNYKTFVDIGAAQGAVPVEVALAHPHLSGGGFDLPPVGPIFNEYVASFGLSDRLRFFPGSFFTDPLPSADVLIMGRILHDWNLEEKRMLIEKVYQALPKNGAFLVCEMLIDDERRDNLMGLLMSLNMLIETSGGFDFTGSDCCGWLREAGFRETRVEPLQGPDWMVVGIK